MWDQRHHHLPRHRSNALLLVLLAALGGCATPRGQATRPPEATTAPAQELSSTDPCAQRLHDLSGGLLLYYFQNHKLPPNLTVLELPGGIASAASARVCPLSNQPYVYDPRGLAGPVGKSRLIVYDSTPSHAGRRWAISMMESEGDQPQTDVIAVPESYFAAPDAR